MKQTTKTTEKINQTKSWFFEQVKKINKPFARLIKKKEATQVNKIRNEKEVKLSPQKYKRS